MDADWAGDRSDRKSTSGAIFAVSGSLVSWVSKKQTTVALSTTEAEYISAAVASQEVVWLRLLLQEFGWNQNEPTVVMEDNQGCIKLASGSSNTSRIKHLDIKHHFIRQLVETQVIKLVYCPSESMLADLMTKPLPSPRFKTLLKLINIVE